MNEIKKITIKDVEYLISDEVAREAISAFVDVSNSNIIDVSEEGR